MLDNKLYDRPEDGESSRTSAARDSGHVEPDDGVPNNRDAEIVQKLIERSTYGMHVKKRPDKRKDGLYDI